MALTRSQQMARIKGKDTTPEKLLRAHLWHAGCRYRLDYRIGRTRPDLVFKGAMVAVYCDGCFWHGCPRHYVRPRRGHAYWAEKLAANLERDRRITRTLEAAGWTVLRIWECEIEQDLVAVASRIQAAVAGRSEQPSPQWRVARVDDEGDQERRYLVDLRDDGLAREMVGPRFARSGATYFRLEDGQA